MEPQNGFPVQFSAIGIGYKVRESEMNHIPELNPKQIFESEDKAISKTMGYMKIQNLRLLRERWSMGDNWYIRTDGGLKGNIGQ